MGFVNGSSPYSFYAPPELHSQINRVLNEKLKGFCRENGYEYIDIHLNGEVVDFVKGELNKRLGINV